LSDSETPRHQAPRVSILMIFLDEERFIEEAIRSVLAQTIDSWELLLVDDGSADGSTAIAGRYAAADPERIRYFEHPGHANRGMSASRNLALRHARGEYVAMLDADDVYLPNKLEDQVRLLDAHPGVGMLYGRTRYWFSWTGAAEDSSRDFMTDAAPEYDRVYEPPELLLLYLKHHRYFPCTCSVLIRRDVLCGVGGFVDEFRGTYEDMAFYAKAFLRHPVLVVGGCWDRYRQHPDSSWAEAMRTGQYVENRPSPVRLALLSWIDRYIQEQGLTGTEVARVVRWKLFLHRYPIAHRAAHLADQLRGIFQPGRPQQRSHEDTGIVRR
jgi:glycosyltransferase involved in cell wall biosynthesis